LTLELGDDDLYIHCLEQKREQYPVTDSQEYIFEHRNLHRYETRYPKASLTQAEGIQFKPYEMKCLKVIFKEA